MFVVGVCYVFVMCKEDCAVEKSRSSTEYERQDDDDVASDDDGLFPSMMIITLFSAAGVPSKRIGI